MCGIVGFIDRGCTTKSAWLDLMERAIYARGPDGRGGYIDDDVAMGMRRLAIIDLAHGDQPLRARDGRVLAFQNGEIYNFRALRRDLEKDGFRFATDSDTEVLAHGYVRWGMRGLLGRIDGMFAIALLDRDERVLYLARDRFGEKPLYYVHIDGRLAYGSDLRVLAALPWVDDAVDPLSLERYLALHYVPGDRTILRQVRKVLPGEFLAVPIDDPKPRRERYYGLPANHAAPADPDRLEALLTDAVQSRLVADVPVGVFLSGGLDSSLVATLAARQTPAIATFSMAFPSSQHDESPYARALARHIGSTHHEFMFDESAFNRLLPEVAAALDEPLGDQAMLPLYWLCREARKHVTVVLAGEGADEMFAGYGYYQPFARQDGLAGRLRAFLAGSREPSPRLLDEERLITPSGFPMLSTAAERRALVGADAGAPADDWELSMIRALDLAADPVELACRADAATWLPDDLLVKFDRMAMANSLEGRAPFLQPELAEYGICRQMPEDRIAGGAGKVSLRRVAARLLPNEILERRKQGFVLPMRSWLDNWFRSYGGARVYFSARSVSGMDTGVAAQIVETDLNDGLNRERFLFALIALAEWSQHFRAKVDELRAAYLSARTR